MGTGREERMEETSKLLVRNVPPRLKGKIVRRVRDEDRNMNDVLVQILADKYGLPYTPSGRKAGNREVGASATIMLNLPPEIRAAIDFDAQTSGDTVRNTAVRVISEALGVPFKETGRWVGARKRAARPRARSRK